MFPKMQPVFAGTESGRRRPGQLTSHFGSSSLPDPGKALAVVLHLPYYDKSSHPKVPSFK